jgi:hypothetical protein
VGASAAHAVIHCSKVAPDNVMVLGFTSSALAVLSSPHSISKVEPSTVYNVPLLAGHEIDAAEGVGRVMFAVAVAFANGARVDTVEKVEKTIVVFSGRELFTGKGLAAVGRVRLVFDVALKGNVMLVGKELAAVVTGNAILDRFAKAEGSAAKGAGVTGAGVELDTALDTAGGLAGAGI